MLEKKETSAIIEPSGALGILELELRDADGKVVKKDIFKNLITNAGLAGWAKRLGGLGSVAAFTYIALGTGTTPAANTDTTLESEISTGGGARKAATPTSITISITDDTLQLVAQFDFTSSFAVTEAGVLNASSSGSLLSRRVFSAYNVTNGSSLTVTWKLQQTRV